MDKKLLIGGVGIILIIVLAAVGMTWFEKSDSFRGTSYLEPYPPAPPIDLATANGDLFHLADQRGKIVLLFFGYTHCPDECPTTMAQLKLVVEDLGSSSRDVQVVLVTTDPDRDTAQVIQDYAGHFDPTFIGLSGTLENLTKIWNQYGISRVINHIDHSSNYMVDHTARIILIDVNGKMRLSYGYQTPYQDIVHDIALLIE
jgi:protein SCO1/2